MGFRLNLKWGALSVHSPLSTSTSSRPSSYSCRGRDKSYCSVTLSTSSPVLHGEPEALSDVFRAANVCSCSSPHILDGYYLGTGESSSEVALGKKSSDSLINNDNQGSNDEDNLAYLTGLQATQAQYRVLMKNINTLEGMFADSNALRLERDILEQLERLGALRLFHSCLSGITLKPLTSSDLSNAPDKIVEEHAMNDSVDNHIKVFVRSGKKEIRKIRRNRKLVKQSYACVEEFASEIVPSEPHEPVFVSFRRNSRSRSKRRKIANNEAEMSSGVQMVSELEKLKVTLEEETCQVASLSSWAEAAGLEKKELQHHIHYGWHCRDELVRSTCSLVMFVAKNYVGLGVGFEDLVQAGFMGVLQGAERFDRTRGYKFSTYVQYWIRKSMSTLVSKHARGVQIPSTISKVINQVQKARKALSASNGKYPDDFEIGKFTGLSMAKIMSTSTCLRVVGSIDQKIGGGKGINIKYMEITPDTSIQSPEETVVRQHMINDIYTLVNGLEPREKQVIILRFGLENNPRKSLEEIGRIFQVSKEWIRRMERSALTKLRKSDRLKI